MSKPSQSESEQFQAGFLDILFQSIDAKRAALLLLDSGGREFATVKYGDPSRSPAPEFPVDRAITDRVLETGIPVFSNEGKGVICVPLVADGATFGVIYVENPEPGVMNEEDRWLTILLAGVTAHAISRSRYIGLLESENRRLKEEIHIRHDMIGYSPKMVEVYERIRKVAAADSRVLITGESGTGKELAARAIHRNSSRANGPFIAVNCGASTESLVESALFGHEKGSFTGATSQQRGCFEAAEGGTIFLDEVGEISMTMQAALLRVLQEKEFRRIGGARSIKTNVRVIAATNRDLAEAIKAGRFREDLWFRLNVVCIRMPSLSERREDIPLLAAHFIRQYSGGNRCVRGVSDKAMKVLMNHEWRGNVRELENAIEHGMIFAETDHILAEDLPEKLIGMQPPGAVKPASFDARLIAAKMQIIRDLLRENDWNAASTAENGDIHVKTVYRLAKEAGISL